MMDPFEVNAEFFQCLAHPKLLTCQPLCKKSLDIKMPLSERIRDMVKLAITNKLLAVVFAPGAEQYITYIPYPTEEIGKDIWKRFGRINIFLTDSCKCYAELTQLRMPNWTYKSLVFALRFSTIWVNKYSPNFNSFHFTRAMKRSFPTGSLKINDE